MSGYAWPTSNSTISKFGPTRSDGASWTLQPPIKLCRGAAKAPGAGILTSMTETSLDAADRAAAFCVAGGGCLGFAQERPLFLARLEGCRLMA